MSIKTLTLYRRYFSHGTFSTLHDHNNRKLCCMVECPSNNNEPNISCVPEGTYELLPHSSPKFGEVYALEAASLGVTRYGPSLRTHILIHVANTPSQLQGCLAPGLDFGSINNEWGVINSRLAFNQLMHYLNGENARLVIKGH